MTEAWSGVIAVEGRPSTDGRLLEEGSVVLPRGPVALIATGPHRIVGVIESVTRHGELIRGDGLLHWEIDIADYALAVSSRSMDAKQDRASNLLRVSKLEIAAVFLSAGAPAWPECVPDA